MKLKNRNPAKFVGRTIVYRHQMWKIESVSADAINLVKPGLRHKMRLQLNQFAECRLFATRAEVIAQFPKLIRALCRICKLSQDDAVVAIRGMITTGSYYMDSGAIALAGGARNAMRKAWNSRHKVQRQAALAVR